MNLGKRDRKKIAEAALALAAERPWRDVTLADIAARTAAAGLASPAILYVGEVVALRPRLDWFGPAAEAAAYNADTAGDSP